MIKAMIGRKMNMTQLWDSHGRVTPVTLIKIEPNIVVGLKDKEKDGYKAVQVGIGKDKKINQPDKARFTKNGLKKFPKVVKEVDFEGDLKIGSEIKLEEIFRKGGMVDVVGTSKGKGFAGVIKRHGFSGGPKTHGQSDRHRAPGSIGSGTTPGRVQKGMKMAGHMGSDQVSIFGLEVVDLNKEEDILIVKGSVPGATGSLLVVKKSKKKKEVYHEPEIPAVPNLGGDSGEKEENQESQEIPENKVEEPKKEEATQ